MSLKQRLQKKSQTQIITTPLNYRKSILGKFVDFKSICDYFKEYKTNIILKLDDFLNKSSKSDRGEFARIMNHVIKYEESKAPENEFQHKIFELENEIKRLGKIINRLETDRKLEKRRLELLEKNILFD